MRFCDQNVVYISHSFHAYQHFLQILDICNLITLRILHEASVLWSSLLCSLFHPPVTFLLQATIFSWTLYSLDTTYC